MAFEDARDRAKEAEVAAQMSAAFKCLVHDFGSLNDVDFWLEKNGKLAAYAELKCRDILSTKHEDVFLSVRKWLALTLLKTGPGVPCLFVVKFSDEVRWIDINDIDASRTEICERKDHRAANDREPVILVPVVDMKTLPNLPVA